VTKSQTVSAKYTRIERLMLLSPSQFHEPEHHPSPHHPACYPAQHGARLAAGPGSPNRPGRNRSQSEVFHTDPGRLVEQLAHPLGMFRTLTILWMEMRNLSATVEARGTR